MSEELKENSHCIADTLIHAFTCNICGCKQPFPELPIDILKFTRIGRKFLNKHQNCKPQKK